MGGEPGSDSDESDLELDQLVMENAVQLGLVQKDEVTSSHSSKSKPSHETAKSSSRSKKTKDSKNSHVSHSGKEKKKKSSDRRPKDSGIKGDEKESSEETFSILTPLTSISKLSKQYRKKTTVPTLAPICETEKHVESSGSNSSSEESSDLEFAADSNNANSSFVGMDRHSGTFTNKTLPKPNSPSKKADKGITSRKSPDRSPRSPVKTQKSNILESPDKSVHKSLTTQLGPGRTEKVDSSSGDSESDSLFSSDEEAGVSKNIEGALSKSNDSSKGSSAGESEKTKLSNAKRKEKKDGQQAVEKAGNKVTTGLSGKPSTVVAEDSNSDSTSSSEEDEGIHKSFETELLKPHTDSKKTKNSKASSSSSGVSVTEQGRKSSKSSDTDKKKKKKRKDRQTVQRTVNTETAVKANEGGTKPAEVSDSDSSSDDGAVGISKSFEAEMQKRQSQQKSSPSRNKTTVDSVAEDMQDVVDEPFADTLVYPVPDGFKCVGLSGSKASLWYEDVNTEDTELWLVRAPAGLDMKNLGGKTLLLQGVQSLGSLGEDNVTYEAQASRDKTQEMKGLQPVLPSKQKKKLCLGPEICGQLNIVQSIIVPPIIIPAVALPAPKALPAGLKPRFKPFGSDSPIINKKTSTHPHKKKKKRKHEPSEAESSSKLAESSAHVSHSRKKKKKHRSDADIRLEPDSTSHPPYPAEIPAVDSHSKKRRRHKSIAEESSESVSTSSHMKRPRDDETEEQEIMEDTHRKKHKKHKKSSKDEPSCMTDVQTDRESERVELHKKHKKKKHKHRE